MAPLSFPDVVLSRRSVRRYTDEPLPAADASWLIGMAVQAPSAVNSQPWHFTVIRDRALLDVIAAEAKRFMLSALSATPNGHLRDMLEQPEFHIFYHAPTLIVISAVTQTEWATIDCALAAENLMLAAASRGLGSCWVGFAQGWLATLPGKTRIGLPAGHVPVAPIVVGRPSTPGTEVTRTPPRIHWIG